MRAPFFQGGEVAWIGAETVPGTFSSALIIPGNPPIRIRFVRTESRRVFFRAETADTGKPLALRPVEGEYDVFLAKPR